jgi:hypothetical protein
MTVFAKPFDTTDDVTTTTMRFGFQLDGRGWRRVMAKLCVRLEPLAQNGFRILAVKSKYGTLHIAYRGGDEMIATKIAAAQAVAARTCQVCGGGAADHRQRVGVGAVRGLRK